MSLPGPSPVFPPPPHDIARTLPPPIQFRPTPPIPSPTLSGAAHSPSYSPSYSPSSSFTLGTRGLNDDLPHSDRFSLSNPNPKKGTTAMFYLDSTPVIPTPVVKPIPIESPCCACACCGCSCGWGCGWDCTGDRMLILIVVLVLLVIGAIILTVLGFTGHLSPASAQSSPSNFPPLPSTGPGLNFPPVCINCRAPSETLPSIFTPFTAPPAVNVTSYCVNLTDATSCLVSLMTQWQGHTITIPYPNAQFPVRLGSVYGQNPLMLLSGTVFHGNNCTFINTATPPGQLNPYYISSNSMMYIEGNTALYNVSFISSIPSYGINIVTGASNVLISSISMLGLGMLNEEGNIQGGVAITLGGNNTNTEVAYSYFTQLGYGLYTDLPYISNLSIHHNTFYQIKADAICITSSPLDNPYTRPTFDTDFVPSQLYLYNNTMRSIGEANNTQNQWGFCIQTTGVADTLIQDNDLSGCSWQGIHIGDASINVRVLNNRIDSTYGNQSIGWAGAMDGINIGRAAQILIGGNTFTNLMDSCIGIQTSCNQLTFPGYNNTLLPLPTLYQTSSQISIINNSFTSWGLSLNADSAAVRGGGFPSQPGLSQVMWGNSYSPQAIQSGLSLTWCYCPGSIEVEDAAPWGIYNSTDGCDGGALSEETCALSYGEFCPALPQSSSSSTGGGSSSVRVNLTMGAGSAGTSTRVQTSLAVPATSTPTPNPTSNPPSPTPTSTPAPAATSAPVLILPTSTPAPIPIPTSAPIRPTSTPAPIPTSAPAPLPATSVPAPNPTSAPVHTSAPSPTSNPAPTPTSAPVPTSTPSPTPTSAALAAPTSTPPASNVDYCLDYGTSDSSACLYTLLETPGVYTVPIPNFVYYVALHVGGEQTPLIVGPNVIFNGNNCTFYNIAPSPYYYDSNIGWFAASWGNGPGNYGWYNFMMLVNSFVTVSNVSFVSPIPSQGLGLIDYSSNIRLLYLSFLGLPGLFQNASTIASVKRAAIDFGQTISDVEIGWCYMYNVGYAIILDAPYLRNVEIHDNVILNVTADGVCVNTPAFGQEMDQFNSDEVLIPYYWVPYAATNLSIHHNSISYTGWSSYGSGIEVLGNYEEESFGFGVSVAGGWNVTIHANSFYWPTWQAIHVEAHSHYTYITDNVIDGVAGQGTGIWTGFLSGLWYADSYVLTVSGNRFANIPSSAVAVTSVNTDYCVPNTGPGTSLPCLTYPAMEWFSQYVVVVGNVFESWGIDGGCHEFAVFIGGAYFQLVNTVVSGNTYNSYYANLPGACPDNVNSYVFCNCGLLGVTVSEPSIPLSGCSEQQYGDSACQLTLPQPLSVLGWWSSLSIVPPVLEQTVQIQPFGPIFESTTFPLTMDWLDSGSGQSLSLYQLTVSAQPQFTPSLPGQPGLQFAPSSSLQGPDIWPVLQDYSLSVTMIPYTTGSGCIVGTTSHSLSILDGGYYYLIHQQQQANASAQAQVIPYTPVVVTVTYTHTTGQVVYYIDGVQSGTAILSVANTDTAMAAGGGGFNGSIFDVQIYSTALDSSTVQTHTTYAQQNTYCHLFGNPNC